MSDVSSILGFEPNEFTSELNKRIDSIIVNYVDRFKQEVKRLITSKGQNKDFDESELDKAADKLLEKMRQQFHRNMNKFDVYCDRNIFVPSSSSVFKMETEDTVSSELEQLRQKYMTLRSQYMDLSASTKAATLFLQDIRASLFQIRVGAQVLDEYNIQPLAETMATLTQQKVALEELCGKAQEWTDKIESTLAPIEDTINTDSLSSSNDKIETKGDIAAVTRSLKGK